MTLTFDMRNAFVFVRAFNHTMHSEHKSVHYINCNVRFTYKVYITRNVVHT